LAALDHESAATGFLKYLGFAVASGVLSGGLVKNLLRFVAEWALSEGGRSGMTEQALQRSCDQRLSTSHL